VDGIVKVTGKADFAGDIVLPRMLQGKILRSPHPHAKILDIDTAKAERLVGVKAVAIGRDTGGYKFGRRGVPDKNLLAVEKVRYVGDEVAAVAATDEDIAEEALDLIRVEYEELPAVFDPEEAMKAGSPRIHDYAENNINGRINFHFGDVEIGFREAFYVREDRFTTQTVAHSAIEPHTALANFETSGKLTIWISTQSPFIWCHQLAQAFSMPESMVRVINPYVGGGFGGKVDMMPFGYCAALLSKKAERPVRIALTREEVFCCTKQRHPMVIYLKTGVKRDGTIVATQCKVIGDGGAYATMGPIAVFLSGAFLIALYKLPNVKFEGFRVYTNKPERGAQRGHGNPQPRFAADSQLDMIAEHLGIDPVEIRLKNALQPGDSLPNKAKVVSCGLGQCIRAATEKVRWNEKRAKEKEGIGMGCSSFVSGVLVPPYNFSGVITKLHPDGAVTVLAGISDIGQGSDTVISQVIAHELGIDLEDIRITSGDTELTPAHPGSFSNRGTLWASNAAKMAAEDCKRQLFSVASQMLEASPEDLEIKNKRIYVKGSPEKGVGLREVIQTSYMGKEGNPIIGKGYFRPNIDMIDFQTGAGKLTAAYSFDTQVAELKVDEDTGQVKVMRITVAHDAGFAINPLSVEGQIEGAISMGLGQALFEELSWTDGQAFNPSFLDYKLITSLDMPEVTSILIETSEPDLPIGAKTSEGTVVSTLPAVANAVYHATGARIKELPITPEKIFGALEALH